MPVNATFVILHVAVQQMYEKAAPFFELAAQVQPQEVKWHLMVASCFRRTGNRQQVTVLWLMSRPGQYAASSLYIDRVSLQTLGF